MTYNPALADAFRKINVSQPTYPLPNETLVEAEQVGDTLTIEAGFGITITADPLTDKIVISNTGNGTGAYTEITDVNSNATYYPLFSRPFAPSDINPLDTPPSYQLDTIYVDNTTTPMTYNPATGTLALQEIEFGDGTKQTSRASITVSSTAPVNPIMNDVWIDSTTGNQYVYYTDIDSSQWIQPANVGYGDTSGQAYTLPIASDSVLGGVKIDGTSITIDGSGVISSVLQTNAGATPPVSPNEGTLWYDTVGGRLYVYFSSTWVDASPENTYYLPTASTTVKGGVLVDGFTITVDGAGVISAHPDPVPATNTTLGSIKVGAGLSITGSGVLSVTVPSLGGDVLGPSSATDNAITRFDTTSGKIIQNSLTLISDSGKITTPAGLGNSVPIFYVDQTQFPNATTNPGLLAHSQGDGKVYFAHNDVWKPLANFTDINVYTPATASNWNGTPPTTISSAIDRLAAVVKALNGGVGA